MAQRRLYWDSCIFFAWLNDEEKIHGPAVMDGIREMVDDFDAGKIVLFSSVMTRTEVYDGKLRTQWAKDQFARVLTRSNFSEVAQDVRIGEKSRNIRDYYKKRDITLDAGDCVHLATAIIYKADVLYTLDGNSNTPKPNALLLLDGDVAGHKLAIKKPNGLQGTLFAGQPQAVSSAIGPKQSRFKTIK